MPTSITHTNTHTNLLSRAFSMLFLMASGLKNNQSLTRLLVVLVLMVSLVPVVRSSAAQAASQHKSQFVRTIPGLTAQTQISEPASFPTDGMYLYGQSSEPGQIGSTYVVFETRDARIVGAFYMPYSSFDCFYGGIEANQLAMTVISSYEQAVHPYSIAIQQDSVVVDASGSATANSLNLEGFHQIDTLEEMDQHVLDVCRTEYSDQVW